MGESEFLGYLIMSIITLGGFTGVINKMTQPVNDLRVVIQELKDCVIALRNENALHTKRLDDLDELVDVLSHRVGKIETTMSLQSKIRDNT